MGDIADMMLDGTLCEGCGVYMGEAVDFPRLCARCARNRRASGHEVERNGLGWFVDCGPKSKPPAAKVSCPTCKKRVKEAGLADHIRDAHTAPKHPKP